MADFAGKKCDVCKGTEDTTDLPPGELPPGWIKVTLPRTDLDHTDKDRHKDICSNACLEKLGRQRREAAGEIKRRPRQARPRAA